ncbi:UTP--glucose-1-phosphate uridylyltransferase [Candidatus Peregrinibacteria bacterium]|nr:UTP--glucose-1-phosphate uridylyltransferase [Candidatus Peregrinibacteria bacterium]
MIKKAILPVAGIGTRFLPATKVVPKELLPIVDKPVIQYLVEEAVSSGIEEIIFVISKDKELIRDYFSPNPELEETLRIKGKSDALQKVAELHKMAKFSYVYQNEPLGDGDAILKAKELIGNEPFMVLFGDDIIKGDVPASKQLIQNYTGGVIIAVEEVDKKYAPLYGIIDPGVQNGNLFEVKTLVEKPSPEEAPSNLGIIGKFICPPEIFEAIENSPSGKDGELRLVDGILSLSQSQKIWALKMEGQRFDTGKPDGLVSANNAYLNA